MAEQTVTQSAKQTARTMGRSFSDRFKVVSAKTSSASTKVRKETYVYRAVTLI